MMFVLEQNKVLLYIVLYADYHVSGRRRCGSEDATGISASAGRRTGGEQSH